jgi:ATP-dependent Clp protease ATP-binding subunit ClpB
MSEFLLNGPDVLKRTPDFKLIGRAEDFTDLCCMLTQSTANSVIAFGPGGVGVSSMALNLQACKADPAAPFDIVSMRLFWLDTDRLFGLGDNVAIDKEFKQILSILNKTPQSVLIVQDTVDMIEALRNCGMMHVINALNSLVKSGKTQAFLEVRDTDLKEVYKAHSDFREHYTLFNLAEPVGGELFDIVRSLAHSLEKSYSIPISDKAVRTAIDVSNRYRSVDTGINAAQPLRSRLLLDRAMSKYALKSHSSVPMLAELEAELAIVPPHDANKAVELARRIESHKAEFTDKQTKIKAFFAAQRAGERAIVVLEEEIAVLVAQEKDHNLANKNNPKKFDIEEFGLIQEGAGFSTPDIDAKRAKIAELEAGVRENLAKYEEITASINARLCLTDDTVISEFSRISGIDEGKLRQNDTIKLLNLGNIMRNRVYGQDDVLEYIFRRVKIWKRGRRTNKPLPFMLCGPSGVGKTELCRALAEGLFDTEQALNKFDMGDFGEKNDLTKLIGAPPGYDGFDVGGQMTNSILKSPYQVMLQDEIEKAHADIFNTYLGVLDNGYCKDNIGRRCEFGDAIMPFTTNIGQEPMLRVGTGPDEITEEEAYNLTMKELEKFFKPEFLNRFEGRENIIILKRLELDSIQRVANRELVRINEYFAPNIKAIFPPTELNRFCSKVYTPKIGARGIPGKIKTIEGFIVDQQLEQADFVGTMNIGFNDQTSALTVAWAGSPA